jgi:sporulation protein YlmC with PRC-barrel domain
MMISVAVAAPSAYAQLGADYPSYNPPSSVRSGYTAEDLLDTEVRGVNGKKVGDIEDLIVGPDGQLRRLIVSADEGLFGTGGRRLAIKWTDVEVRRAGKDLSYVSAPVSEQNAGKFGVFTNKPEHLEGKPREWRATELLGDYVSLKDISDYGSVTDLMFDRSDRLQAIAAAPDMSGSVLPLYAGFEADGWEPGDDYYVVPYTQNQLAEVLPEQMQRSAQKPATRKSDSASSASNGTADRD